MDLTKKINEQKMKIKPLKNILCQKKWKNKRVLKNNKK